MTIYSISVYWSGLDFSQMTTNSNYGLSNITYYACVYFTVTQLPICLSLALLLATSINTLIVSILFSRIYYYTSSLLYAVRTYGRICESEHWAERIQLQLCSQLYTTPYTGSFHIHGSTILHSCQLSRFCRDYPGFLSLSRIPPGLGIIPVFLAFPGSTRFT